MKERQYTVLGDHRSGNCYKVALILELTGCSYQWIETDVLSGATRTSEFLNHNPNGRVPLLQLHDGSWLAESNAMLIHLAEGTRFLPEDRIQRARVFQWLFFEQYSHEPYIAVARFLTQFDHGQEPDPDRLQHLCNLGHQALEVMETILSRSPFIAIDQVSIADFALYAYTHVAGEGGFELSGYPAVRAWLARVAALPGHFDLAELGQTGRIS